LATQESILAAYATKTDSHIVNALKDHYFELRAGIGINKSPQLYGAFPTDAYSHTPSNAGAQQPGMTGQVKEDIMNRWAELGLEIKKGTIEINPIILDPAELLDHDSRFEYLTNAGEFKEVAVPTGGLAFTYCGILFTYTHAKNKQVKVHDGKALLFESNDLRIDEKHSLMVFNRSKNISEIEVSFPFL
jgi:hypothetical protein